MPPEAIAARWSAAAAARRAHRPAHRAARSGRHRRRHRRRIGGLTSESAPARYRPARRRHPRRASVPYPIRTRAASPTSAVAPRITRCGRAKCAGERRAFRVNRAESATSPTTGASRSRAAGRPPQSDRSAARHADAPAPRNGERPARQRTATGAASAIRAFSSGLPATKYFFAHRESGCSARPPCAPAFPAVEPPPSPRREAIASARAR